MYVVFQVFRKILVNIMDMYIRDVHIMFEVERNLYIGLIIIWELS